LGIPNSVFAVLRFRLIEIKGTSALFPTIQLAIVIASDFQIEAQTQSAHKEELLRSRIRLGVVH